MSAEIHTLPKDLTADEPDELPLAPSGSVYLDAYLAPFQHWLERDTVTEIIVFGPKEYTAHRIAGWLGVSTEQVRQSTPADEALRTNASADIVIVLGDDAEIESVQAP